MTKRSGSALILVITLSSLLLLVALGATINSVSNIGLTNEEKIKIRLELACEAGLKRAKAKIEESFNNSSLTYLEPIVSFQGTDYDDTGKTPEEKAYSDEVYTPGSPAYYSFTYHSDEDNRDIQIKYAITEEADWQKSQNYTTYKLNIESIAYSPGYGFVAMTEQSAARRTTLFMYQVFFQNDLEILPGPNFDLKGLIHTNEDLYLNSNNTLKIYTDSITSAGEAFRGRLDENSAYGTVQISSENKDGSLTTMNVGEDANNDEWTDLASEKWKGTLRDKNLGATKLEAPKLASFQPGGYYDTNAGLKIKVLAKGKTLSKITYQITYNGSTSTYTSTQLGGALKDTDMYDRREYGTSKTVRVTNVDIQKLATTLGYPSNGLVYMTRDDAVADTDGNDYVPSSSRVVTGFKLYNGSVLPDSTTFVSNLPTYIKGDFNVHSSTDPNVDTWKPCAVIADAIDLLSNSWLDSASNTSQVASSTTYNTVFITGNVPTRSGQYSGGLENFPRFLENWSGKNVNISGGFIQLFRSSYATGLWGGSYYSAPTRSWKNEERFANLTDLPPSYANLFPSTNLGLAFSKWTKISKSEASLNED
jgi:hypothetical protein